MKKFIPFVFIAIMAGLVGVKVAIAADAPTPVAEIQQ